MATKRAFNKVTFSGQFEGPMEKRKKWIADYLEIVGGDNDKYMHSLLHKIIKEQELKPNEISQIDDMIANIDLEELLVNSILSDGEKEVARLEEAKEAGRVKEAIDNFQPKNDIERRVTAVMKAGDKLAGWDRQFVFGDSGTALLDQVMKRGGWLSEKQLSQLSRIERVLRI